MRSFKSELDSRLAKSAILQTPISSDRSFVLTASLLPFEVVRTTLSSHERSDAGREVELGATDWFRPWRNAFQRASLGCAANGSAAVRPQLVLDPNRTATLDSLH